MKIENVKKIAERMVNADRERDASFSAYERMYHLKWDLPEEISTLQWIRKVVSSDPHDAIIAGVRVLSSLQPRVTFQPLADNVATKERANEVERNLSWQLMSANKRRQGTVQRDVILSALLYDEVVAQVVDLEYQIAQIDAFKGETKRLKAARRYGRFMINAYNPKDVHVRYSSVMPEAVLLRQVKYASDVVSEWGDLAKKLRKTGEEDARVIVNDYCDYDWRAVWVSPEGGGDADIVILNEEHKLPFLPWVAMVGGTTIEHAEKDRRHPMLYSVNETRQWDTQNVIRTLYISEVVSHAAAPRFAEEGANPDTAQIDYGDPTLIAKEPPGNTLKQLIPPPIDGALAQIDDRVSQAIDKSTVSRVLMSGDVPSGTAFATLNLATQTAVGALKPGKELAEKAMAEVFSQMLLWCHYSGKALRAYGTAKDDNGKQYLVRPEEIAPEAVYISVELTPDVPTDRQARINASAMAVRELQYPVERALEDIGVTDPQEAMKTRYFEMLVQAEFEKVIAAGQMELQMQQQAMQMQMQAQMQAQQAQEQMMAQQQMAQPGMGMEPQGIPGMEGMGFDPSQGGLPAQMGQPNATREMQTGVDNMGTPVQGGGF